MNYRGSQSDPQIVFKTSVLERWESPPMRGRGLKLENRVLTFENRSRPPCGGVD
jgi:hypothetical protein